MRVIRVVVCALAIVGGVGCPDGRRPETSVPPPGGAAAGNQLNVLLITIDTLRADHMSLYGYERRTSPRLDALGESGVTFEEAYTYWPKTRGSFVGMMTGRLAAESGYGKTHPLLLDFNPTLASVLQDAGYDTVAVVDNPNVAASLGYSKGFRRYRETWEEEALADEIARAQAITEDGIEYLQHATADRPFLLWLHYVNPHAPYTPPSPFDETFLDEASLQGPALEPVASFHGGVPRAWEVEGKPLGFYVAQYDGEILYTDQEVGRVLDALRASAVTDKTIVVVTSDHGESLGEHDYFFDHGQNLYDPSMRVPLIMSGPGFEPGLRSETLATTLDLVPTVLDAVKVSYPPGLTGHSLLAVGRGGRGPSRKALVGQNDRNLIGTWDERFKLVATPTGDGARYALYDRDEDPGETGSVAEERPEDAEAWIGDLERFRRQIDAKAARTARLLEGQSPEENLSDVACENLKALGYIQDGCP